MKKKLRLLPVCFFLVFLSCSHGSGGSSAGAGVSTEDARPEVGSKPTQMAQVEIVNPTSYDVNLFVGLNPLQGTATAFIPKGSRYTHSMLPTSSSGGDSFYFEYLIPLGETTFPYFSYENSQSYHVGLYKDNQITVGELTQCKADAAYLLLENTTKTSVYLVNGNTIMTPEGQASHLLEAGGTAVYAVAQNAQVSVASSAMMKVAVGTSQVPLPDYDFEQGRVYTFSVVSSSSSSEPHVVFKGISPFDLDVSRQIWQLQMADTESRRFRIDCVRPSREQTSGLVVAGVDQVDGEIFLREYDVYGACTLESSFTLKASDNFKVSVVCDLVEGNDNDYILLVKLVSEADESLVEYVLISWNPNDKRSDWNMNLSQFKREGYFIFREGCQNSLIQLESGVYALAGGIIQADGMHHFVGKVDTRAESNNLQLSSYVSESKADIGNGVQQMFTSLHWTGSSLIAVGYENCDFLYNTSLHRGVVYQLDSGLTAATVLHSSEGNLFFGVEGSGDTYYVCGESTGTGSILYGCFLTSTMIHKNLEPVRHTSSGAYNWFNQLCLYGNTLVLCGLTSDSMDGSTNAHPIVASYNTSGQMIWENVYSGQNNAASCVPNKIGTYWIHLTGGSGGHSIVSGDLLGKNTGRRISW